MGNLKDICIGNNYTIRQALSMMSANSLRMRVVVDDDNRLIGIITDPDIRRGLLNGLNLDSSIESIIKKNPVVANINDTKETLFKLSSQHNIYEIPLIDNDGRVVKVISILNLLNAKNKPNKVVIMAGGLGTRLKPLTDNTPKPMLKVGTKPILQIILERFRIQGFSEIILCVNYKSDVIEKYFGNGEDFGLNIEYIKEEKRMGTAGALSLIKETLKESFFVMNGDILSDIDFNKMLDFHNMNKSYATMGVREFAYQVPYGVVESVDSHIKSIVEKPIYNFFVSAGIYLFEPSVLELIPRDKFFDMPSLFVDIASRGGYDAKSYLIEEYWIDIGRHEEYELAQNEYI